MPNLDLVRETMGRTEERSSHQEKLTLIWLAILSPVLAWLLPEYPGLRVEIINDYL